MPGITFRCLRELPLHLTTGTLLMVGSSVVLLSCDSISGFMGGPTAKIGGGGGIGGGKTGEEMTFCSNTSLWYFCKNKIHK